MRVLLATIRDPGQIGGTSTHLEMLSRGLQERGHEVRVLYLGAELPGWANQWGLQKPAGALNRARRGWGMVYAGSLRGRLLARRVHSALEREPVEAINAQEVYSVPFLRAVADRHGLPLILTLHGYPVYESESEGYSTGSRLGMDYLRRTELSALRQADAVVTVDSRLHRHVLRLAPELGTQGRARALFNFVDTSAFAPSGEGRAELRERWGVPPDATVLFCPRRLVKKNGVVFPALALASMAPAERSRFRLLHAGEGGERPALEAIVREHGLGEQVTLLGGRSRQAIAELYRLADIVLVPSVHSANVEEATSLAALEAMASGRPLIAGAVGGLAEMVRDGENGRLFPGGDEHALAAAILRLADDPPLGRRLAGAAREYVVAHHSHLTAADAYVEVYRSAREATPGLGGASPSYSAPAAAPPPTVSVLGFSLHLLTVAEAFARLRGRLTAPPGKTTVVASFNPELVVRAQHDARAAEALLATDLRLPDGVGAVWAARRQGARGAERVAGIELAEALLAEAARVGASVYLLGAAPGVAAEAAQVLKARMPGLVVAGTNHGYFTPAEEAGVVASVRASGAGLLLVALGAPRQEVFLTRHRAELQVPLALGVGGSFDVWAGRVRRAPAAVRRLGVEWLYRLLTDPRRLRRQLALPRFAWRVLTGGADDYGPGRGARRAP